MTNLRVQTFIEHEFPGFLVVNLYSPLNKRAALVVTVGGRLENIYNGTIWDDAAMTSASTYHFIFDVPAPVLSPADSFITTFDGVNPNGEWKLEIIDDVSLAPESNLLRWTIDFSRKFLFLTSTILLSLSHLFSDQLTQLSHVLTIHAKTRPCVTKALMCLIVIVWGRLSLPIAT